MGSDPHIVHETLDRLIEEAGAWPEISIDRGPEVTKLVLGRGVIGRFHPDGLVEIPFPRRVGERLVAAGRAERHHALPDSGWVDVRIASAEDTERVRELLRLAYAARRPEPSESSFGSLLPPIGAARDLQRVEREIDESGEESFPASDPPARGRE